MVGQEPDLRKVSRMVLLGWTEVPEDTQVDKSHQQLGRPDGA